MHACMKGFIEDKHFINNEMNPYKCANSFKIVVQSSFQVEKSECFT